MTYLLTAARCAAAGAAVAVSVCAAPDKAEAGTSPFLGDILAVGEDFCPRGWASADGQLLPISQYTALFSLFGTTYGGDGRTTFGLPDLRGRIAMHTGTGPGLSQRRLGSKFGAEEYAIQERHLPPHNHMVNANNRDGNKPGPGGKLLAAAPPSGAGSETIYSTLPPNRTMNPQMIGDAGGGLPTNTQSPFLVMRYCIALEGIYPSRN